MTLATTHMIALADDSTIHHYHGSYHRVRPGTLNAIGCQLQAAAHVFFVFAHYFFTFLLFYLFTFSYLCSMTYNELWRQIAHIYDDGEAKAIARMVYEVRFGLSPSDLFLGKDTQLSTDDQKLLEEIARRLMTGEPVQYAIGLAEFGGRTFHVEPGVLIPRPETYELCQWIVSSGRQRTFPGCPCLSAVVRCQKILDIGTGSGCIACTLAADIPDAQVTAWDISEEALRIAAENAKRIGVTVRFEQRDILNDNPSPSLPPCYPLATPLRPPCSPLATSTTSS
jgi:hypothetical protein